MTSAIEAAPNSDLLPAVSEVEEEVLETRGDRLRQARERLGLTQSEAAERLGVPLSTYSSKERAQGIGGRDYKWEEAKNFARLLQVNAGWLFTGEGEPPSGSAIKLPSEAKPAVRIVGYVGASSGEGGLYGFAHDQFDEVDRPPFARENTVAVEIKGKSFGPLMEGMLVFYDDVRRPITDDLINCICVVGLADKRIVLKKVTRGSDGWKLLSNTPDVPPIENPKIEWAAKMIAIVPR